MDGGEDVVLELPGLLEQKGAGLAPEDVPHVRGLPLADVHPVTEAAAVLGHLVGVGRSERTTGNGGQNLFLADCPRSRLWHT